MADTYNFLINQGETFNLTLQTKDCSGNPINLTDSYVRSYAKYLLGDSISGATFFACGIISPPASGIVSLDLTSQQTAALKIARMYYDVEKYTTGASGIDSSVTKLLRGYFDVVPEVTV